MSLINSIGVLTPQDISGTFGSTFDKVPVFDDGTSRVTVTSALGHFAARRTFDRRASAPDPLPTGTGSLSGSVYVDWNHNGVIDGADYVVAGAKVSLMLVGGTVPQATAYTDSEGNYHFSDLGAGSFYVRMDTPVTSAGQDTGGSRLVLDKDGTIIDSGSAGVVLENAYDEITLGDGQQVRNLNLAQASYPRS